MRKPGRRGGLVLLRMMAAQGHSSLSTAGLVMGLGLLGTGGALVLLPFFGGSDDLTVEDLSLGIFGCAAISVGILLLVNATLCHLSYEILLHLDGDDDEGLGAKADRPQNTDALKCVGNGSSDEPRAESWLRGLSTRDLSAGWFSLVMTPLVVGTSLCVLMIGAWLGPTLDAILLKRGVRSEYLLIVGLVFMLIGAHLMLLEAVIRRKRRRLSQSPEAVR